MSSVTRPFAGLFDDMASDPLWASGDVAVWDAPLNAAAAITFTPPVFHPPVFTPPVFTPPVYTPPAYTPPTFSPPPPPPAPPAPPPPLPPGIAPVEPPSPSTFTINITWDSSTAAAPQGFFNDVLDAVQYLELQFSDPVSINIDVGYEEVDGQPLGAGDLGESATYPYVLPAYSYLRAAVAADAATSTDASVVASLPVTSPLNGATYVIATAEAKALGLLLPASPALDGAVGFGPQDEFTYGDSAGGGYVAPDTYDFFGTVVHEITEVMGRELDVGDYNGIPNIYSLLDLLHYSAPGVHDYVQTTPGYFSANNGQTNLGEFNTIIGGDAGDWASSETDNPYDAFATPGVAEPVSANDLTVMDAIGWNPTGSTPSAMQAAPASVSFIPMTQALASAQGHAGLAAGSTLTDVTQIGGTNGDQFSYQLSGTDAGLFHLTVLGGQEVLQVGPTGAPGAANGRLYALTVTATDDTAAGAPAVADPINVVVGDQGNDIIHLASLPGMLTSTPTFIYGLGGNVTIDGTGMTGPLYIDGGSGADTMTGGAGGNVYEYAGALDSHASAMDIITNFNVALDTIDLSGVFSPLANVGALADGANSIEAGSIGWQTSGGNTFVYANTSTRNETLTGANMEIELKGSIALSATNFGHA